MVTMIIGAAISGAISGALAVGVAFSWSAFATAFASSLLLGGVSKAFQKKPSASGATINSSQSGRLITVRQSIAPWQIIYGQTKVGGVITFFEASSDNQQIHLVITLAGHECEEIGDIYFNDELVPLDGSNNATGKYAGYVHIEKNLGDPADASQPFPNLVAASASKWTNAHLQRGRAKIYVRLTANPDLFPTGIPNIAAVVKGVNNITDPRDSSTGWTDNAVLCLQHYLYDTTFGVGARFPDEFETTSIAAEASICDELVNRAGSPTTTEKRYTINGAFLTSEKPKAVIEIMLAAMGGRAVNVGGLWYIYTASYSAPSVTLDEDDFDGAISIQTHVSRRESFNAVKGIFTDPNNAWQATDFPALLSSTYYAEDTNVRTFKDMDLSGFVTSGSQAQRLAKIELLRARQGLSVTATFRLAAYAAMTGRTVALTFAKYGWSAKPFDVVNTRFVPSGDGKLNVELSLRETAAAVYDWSTSEEQTVDIAPNTNLPDISAVGTPSALTFTPDDYLVRGEGDLTWTAPSDALVMEYVVEYKTAAASDWNVLSPVTGTAKRITNLQPGDYNFRVKARNYFGVAGAYTALTQTISTPSVGNVSGLELFEQPLETSFVGQSAKFVWRHSSVLWADGFGEVTGTGGLEYYWKDYQVEISVSGTVRRVEWTTEAVYTYTYEKNCEDGDGTPTRSFTIKVYKRGRYGQLSAVPAQLTVSNTSPTIANFAVTGVPDGFQFTYDQPTDTDFLKVEVHASQTSGFTPGTSTLMYGGDSRTRSVVGLRPSQRYYVKYIPYDKFGAGSTSSEYTVDTTYRSIGAWAGSFDGLGQLTQISIVSMGVTPNGVTWVPASNLLFVISGHEAASPVGAIDIIDPVFDVKIGSIDFDKPESIVYCPSNAKLYVGVYGGTPNKIKVINPTSRAIETTINLSYAATPFNGLFCPRNGYLYFAQGARVVVINPATNTEVTTITLTGIHASSFASSGMCFCSSNGLIYVVSAANDRVIVIDPDTNTATAGISVGALPLHICYSPSNDRLYVTNFTGQSISVINPVTASVVATITGGSPTVFNQPGHIVYCPENGLVYMADIADDQVHAIRPSDNTLLLSNDVNDTPDKLCWVPNVKKMYVSNASNWYEGSGTLTSFSV